MIKYLLQIVFLLLPSFLYSQERENLDQNFNRVIQVLDGRLVLEERPLLMNFGGFDRSLLARIPGVSYNDETRGTFVLAVPLYADFSVDTAIALAGKLTDQQMPRQMPQHHIIVAFLADERLELQQDGNSHEGLRDLLTLVDMPENWVLCYLDIDEAPKALLLHHGIGRYLAPLEIIESLTGLLSSRDIPWSFNVRHNTIYKLGLTEGPELLSIVWEEEINGVFLSAEQASANSIFEKTILPGDLAELFLEYVFSLDFPVINADRHYSFFISPGGRLFFISEGLTVLFLMAITGFSLFIYLLYSTRKHLIVLYHVRFFLKYIWIFLLLLPLLAFLFKASGVFYYQLLSFFNPSFKIVNITGVSLILLLAALAFFLPSPVIILLRFNRMAWFYGFSGVIWVTLGMLFAIFVDFSHVLVFLWAYCFVFLGASLSNPILVLLCAIMMPLFAFASFFNISEASNNVIVELFIFSSWNDLKSWLTAFQTAFFTLPVFLLFKRGIILFQKMKNRNLKPKPKSKLRLITVPALIAVVIGMMIIQIMHI